MDDPKQGGLFDALKKQFIEHALEAEMDAASSMPAQFSPASE